MLRIRYRDRSNSHHMYDFYAFNIFEIFVQLDGALVLFGQLTIAAIAHNRFGLVFGPVRCSTSFLIERNDCVRVDALCGACVLVDAALAIDNLIFECHLAFSSLFRYQYHTHNVLRIRYCRRIQLIFFRISDLRFE